jgi:hypothetical protein
MPASVKLAAWRRYVTSWGDLITLTRSGKPEASTNEALGRAASRLSYT